MNVPGGIWVGVGLTIVFLIVLWLLWGSDSK